MIDSVLMIDDTLNIRDSISQLVLGKRKVLFVVDENQHLLGLFTNGDMRKVLLTNRDLSEPISKVMNPNPAVFHNKQEAVKASRKCRRIVYPIVNENLVLKDALFDDDPLIDNSINTDLNGLKLVIMAGGKGTRLYPYTKILPKALIPIGDKTITEHIIDSFHKYGCNDVIMVLNHKEGMIKAYFNDLDRDYSIDYITEGSFLGTAGGLGLLKGKVNKTFIVTNCDILVDDDLSCAYKTHQKSGFDITMICSAQSMQIPYGVIKTDINGMVESIDEKPKMDYLINTGVYILNEKVLDLIAENQKMDMPDLIRKCSESGGKVGVFPVGERAWLDMGQFNTMEQMNKRIEAEGIR